MARFRTRPRPFLTSVVAGMVVVALALAVIALIVAGEASRSRRDHLSEDIEAFEFSVQRIQQDVYRLAADARALALGSGPTFLTQAEATRAQLGADLEELDRAAAPAGFAAQAQRIGMLARDYDAIAVQTLAAARAGNLDGAQRLVVAQGAPALAAFTAKSVES